MHKRFGSLYIVKRNERPHHGLPKRGVEYAPYLVGTISSYQLVNSTYNFLDVQRREFFKFDLTKTRGNFLVFFVVSGLIDGVAFNGIAIAFCGARILFYLLSGLTIAPKIRLRLVCYH